MNSWQKFLRHGRAHPRSTLALAVALLLLIGLVWLLQHASAEAQSRKDPAALQFENDPDAWLTQPRSVSDFVQAATNGQLAAVGLAGGKTGLALYTLKNGDKASIRVPGCSLLGCSGTVLDHLGERSATDGFALVGIAIDGRTQSQRVLGAIEAAVPPILLVVLLGGALLMMTRL